MTDDLLLFGGDDASEQVNLSDEIDDLDIMVDGDDKALSAQLNNTEDDEFKLEDYNDLAAGKGPEEEGDDEEAQIHDSDYEDNVVGGKRKRVKPSPAPLKPSRVRSKEDNAESFILEEDLHLVVPSPSRIPGTFGRKDRKQGESLPAYHKRVSHELDSDDELMMSMREKGFSDRQIADKLDTDGRVSYDVKSISTRIMRIRLAQAANVDFLIKEGYKEWKFEDDCLLMQANALADIEINYEIERLRAWRFRRVSEYMRRLDSNALFSETACRERYNSLIEGTARIPTDLDDNPEARRAEMKVYRESREKIRLKEQEEKDAQELLERTEKNKAKILSAQKAEEAAAKRAEKENESAQRALQRAATAQARAQRALENSTAKTQRNAQIKKQQNSKVQGKAVVSKPAPKTRSTAIVSTPSPAKARSTATASTPSPAKAGSTAIASPPNPAKARNTAAVSAPNPTKARSTAVASTPSPTKSGKAATASTPSPSKDRYKRLDPRACLSYSDLAVMCTGRGIDLHGKTKNQLLTELEDLDKEWSINELKKMCGSKGIKVINDKAQMRYALALKAARQCKSFREDSVSASGSDMERAAKRVRR